MNIQVYDMLQDICNRPELDATWGACTASEAGVLGGLGSLPRAEFPTVLPPPRDISLACFNTWYVMSTSGLSLVG